MSMSASSTRSAPGSGTSASAQTRSKAMSGHLHRLLLEARQRTEAGLDGAHQAVLQLGDADVLDDVGEETPDDQAARGLGVDAPRAEVEQLLVVEAAGGAGVASAGDLTRLGLQARHRGGAGAVGGHRVGGGVGGGGAGRRGRDAGAARSYREWFPA